MLSTVKERLERARKFGAHIYEIFAYERRIPKRVVNSRAFCSVTLLRDRIRHALKNDRPDSETIYLHLPSFPQRYLYLVLYFFGRLGAPMKLIRRERLDRYRRLLPEGRLIYKMPNLKVVQPPKHRVRARMFVGEDLAAMPVEGIEREIRISPDVSEPRGEGSMMMPYPAFPLHYHDGRMATLGAYRALRRRVRVFFAGATWHYRGRGHAVDQLFGKQPRLDALVAMQKRLDPDQVLKIDAPQDRRAILQGEGMDRRYVRKLLLSTAKGRPEDWLCELARTDFFVSLSGIKMPICHNAIEAMAVGSIPILSCPAWFSPHLEHGHNCLVYDGEDGLIAALRQALNMDAARVAEMRENAARYYDDYLSPDRFMSRLMTCPVEDLTLYVNCELRDIFSRVRDDSILFSGEAHRCPPTTGRTTERPSSTTSPHPL